MVTISPALESKLYRFNSQQRDRWFDDPCRLIREKYQSVFAEDSPGEEPLSPPVYDPEPPVHTD